jgi:hypothetical protein
MSKTVKVLLNTVRNAFYGAEGQPMAMDTAFEFQARDGNVLGRSGTSAEHLGQPGEESHEGICNELRKLSEAMKGHMKPDEFREVYERIQTACERIEALVKENHTLRNTIYAARRDEAQDADTDQPPNFAGRPNRGGPPSRVDQAEDYAHMASHFAPTAKKPSRPVPIKKRWNLAGRG